jgi:hypothetical protein
MSLAQLQNEYPIQMNRRIRALQRTVNYKPYPDMSRNLWEIMKLSPVLEVKTNFGTHKEMLILARQKHLIKVNKKDLKFIDYAIFTDLLIPGAYPSDRYFGTLKGARTAFKAQVEKYEKGQKTKSKTIRSKS